MPIDGAFKFCADMAKFFYMLLIVRGRGQGLKVIPVIDVLNGIVVHAVRGKRKEYQPLKSILTSSVDPLEVAKAFKTLGFNELYLADLDAIAGKQPNYQIYKRIANETGLNLMVDAGITDHKTAKKVLNSQVSKLIIGTETLPNQKFLKEAITLLNANRVVVSLDLMAEKVLVKPGFDGSNDALGLLCDFQGLGVLEFIVLDLARVGSSEGVNVAFLKRAMALLHGGVYVGGGVRDVTDLVELKNMGVSGVLLATALHSGKISIADLKQAQLI
jgi:phosphoribosylformimino-5-aminoimidazole carboxamide ribotide isomerase